MLWVYEQGEPIRRSSPQKEARVRDFYTLTSATGERDLSFEQWLSGVEENAARIIRKPVLPFSEEDRSWLALFIGTLFTRTPLGREINDTRVGPAADRFIVNAAQDPDKFRKLIADLKIDEMEGVDVEAVRRRILEGRTDDLRQTPEHQLECIAHVGAMCGEELFKKDWQVVFANEEEFFVTSDSPVVPVAWEPQNRARFYAGFSGEDADIYFPLTGEACLHIRAGITPGTYVIRDRGVRYINNLIMTGAHKRIYAGECSKALQTAFDKNGCKYPPETFQPRWEGTPI